MANQSITRKSGKKQRNNFKNLIGQKFGRLLVLEEAEQTKSGVIRWRCECECGNIVPVQRPNLISGHTKSCGCLRKEKAAKTAKAKTTHGMSGTTAYKSWANMLLRCTNINDSAYKYYGGRGITVCKKWLSFENFFADMGECPKGLTIERRDNMSGYFKENCYWADRTTQARNTRLHSNNKTGFVGVCFYKRRSIYVAQIAVNKKTIHLGYFADINDAIRARKAGELKYWTEK